MQPAPPRQAVLLAAGQGTRLKPYTDLVPKPMLRLNGRPLLHYLLDNLRRANIRQVLIITGHLAEEIQEFFGSGASMGMDLHYIRQPTASGTGAAALLAKKFVGDEPFFLGWGDVIAARSDYQRLINAYRKIPYSGFMGLEYLEDPQAGASIVLEGSRVTQLIEKPPPGTAPSPWNQAGLSIYTAQIFPCLERLHPSPRGELEFTEAVQLLVEEGGPVYSLPLQHPRLHLTHPGDIPKVEARLRIDLNYR
jgi:bifunctional UDP-N-acetylglucosamine pyrophosphorylase/glucosamine-1-phosphate N-acetyltransferase